MKKIMIDRTPPTITEQDMLNLGLVKTKHLTKKESRYSKYCYVYLYDYLTVFMKRFDCEENHTPCVVRHDGREMFLHSKEELKTHLELWMEYKEEPIERYVQHHKERVKNKIPLRSFS